MMTRWEGLSRRVINALSGQVPDEEPEPIAWAEGLSDAQFMELNGIGTAALARFRAHVPPPHPDRDPRAERAILGRAEAYRLVEEAREQRERAEKAEDMLRARELEIGLVDAAVALALENLERGDELSALDQLRGILADADHTRAVALLEAARRCADLLVGIVRPMYAGPSGDQGLNDPRYLECKAAIESYRRAARMGGGEDAR
jgi:hypothetical protein